MMTPITASVSPTPEEVPSTTFQGNILVVDDDEAVREVVADFLESLGYTVLQASSAAAALDMVANTPAVRLIVTDVRMPGMSGIELADRAKNFDAKIGVILISGFFLPQTVKQRFLRKPFRMSELKAAVLAELAG